MSQGWPGAATCTGTAPASVPAPHSLLHKSSFGIRLPPANQKGKQSPQIKCAPYSLTKRGQQLLPPGLQARYTFMQELFACKIQPGHWAPTHQLCMKPKTGLHLPQQAHCPADKYNHCQSFQDGITWLHRITQKYYLWVRNTNCSITPEDVRSICCMDNGFMQTLMQISCQWQGKNGHLTPFL